MKKLGIILGTGLLILSLSVSKVQAQGQGGDQASADASVEIIEGISISNNGSSLDFGAIVNNTTGSILKVKLNPDDNTRDVVVGNAVLAENGSAAQFTVSGADDKNFVVDLPSSVDLGSGTVVPTITDFTTSLSNDKGTIPSDGSDKVFQVGGTISIGTAQSEGTYSGSFDVTVNYE